MTEKKCQIDKESGNISAALKKFKDTTKSPEIYLKHQKEKAEKNKEIVKYIYDHTKANENGSVKNIPKCLFIEDMDGEQIWQQLELQNNSFWTNCVKNTAKLLSFNDTKFLLNYKSTNNDTLDEENTEPSSDNAEQSDESDLQSDDDSEKDKTEKRKKKIQSNRIKKFSQKSELDDKFFKESDMEEFLELEEKRQMQKDGKLDIDSDDEIDYFNDDLSGDNDDDSDNDDSSDAKKAMYNDFFDPDDDGEEEEIVNEQQIEEIKQQKRANREERNKLKEKLKKIDLGIEDSDIDENEEDESADENDNENNVRFDMSKNTYLSASESEDNNEEENENEMQENNNNHEADEDVVKSSFEQRQERLRLRINDLEEKALGEKPWQLKGEVDSASRPQNSLLEEVLQFDSTTRPVPIITEETTLKLEDIIKQRIKDKAWNDVELKFKPTNTPQEFRKKLILDQEKSKESLAQIYEKEYIKEMDKLNPDQDNDDKEDEEPQQHKDIRKAMQMLFVKLDALSNFFYTPKPCIPDAKIITNTPAINMEEVAPIATSAAMLLAPEEIKSKFKGELIGKSERNISDKNRERRQKKIKQKQHKIAKEKRDIEKEKAGIKSSTKQENGKLLEKVTKNRNVNKMKETTDVKSFKSSKSFFTQLDESSIVSGSNATKKKKRSIADNNQMNAKKFKL